MAAWRHAGAAALSPHPCARLLRRLACCQGRASCLCRPAACSTLDLAVLPSQDHQLAVVDCLRSPDVTLKRKTLQLLYKMAGPTNIEVRAAAGARRVCRAGACWRARLRRLLAPEQSLIAWCVAYGCIAVLITSNPGLRGGCDWCQHWRPHSLPVQPPHITHPRHTHAPGDCGRGAGLPEGGRRRGGAPRCGAQPVRPGRALRPRPPVVCGYHERAVRGGRCDHRACGAHAAELLLGLSSS